MNSKYQFHPAYKARFAEMKRRGWDDSQAHIWATSAARRAIATRGMSQEERDDFFSELNKMQQETWNREG